MTKPIQRLALVTCLLGCVALAGCKTRTLNTTERELPEGVPNIVNDRRITTDRGLEKVAQVVQVREGMTSGDLLLIQVDVYNSTSKEQAFNYKFEWVDLGGMQVQTPLSNWQPRSIKGQETITIQAIAPLPQARDFRLKLQESKR